MAWRQSSICGQGQSIAAELLNLERRMSCRADLVVNAEKEDLVQRSREVTGGHGAYTSLDPVAGTFTDTVSCCQTVVWRRLR